MQYNITEIYRIETMNSVYEVKVILQEGQTFSLCQKMGKEGWKKQVKEAGTAYLDALRIGASFKVPGVVDTSNVTDYAHFVLSREPKRKAGSATGIPEFFEMLAEHVKEQANPKAVLVAPGQPATEVEMHTARVYKGYGPGCSETNHVGSCSCDLPPACKVPGCTYSSKYGPGHNGSRGCKSGSIASGGSRSHCSCDYCY